MLRIAAIIAALALAFLAGNMLAHQNDALPITLVAAIALAAWGHGNRT